MDARIVVWVATHRAGPLDALFVALGTIEKLGAVWIVLAFAVGGLERLGWRRSFALAVYTALVTLAADAASFAVKDLTHRPRPFVAHPQIEPLYVVHSSSMPAGHAATAFAGAVLLSSVRPQLRVWFVVLAATIAFSRIYVGVHYPTDVLAGAAIGVAVGGAGALLLRWARPRLASVGLRQEPSGGLPNVSP